METTIKHKRMMALIAAFAGLAWAGVVGLVFLLDAGDYADIWFPARVVTYVLMLIAPALTFMPMGRAMGTTLYGYWSVLSWAAFGFVFAFLSPALGNDATKNREENLGLVIILLVCFFAVLVSFFLPICYAVGLNLFAHASRPARYDLRRATREAVLLALYFLLIAFMQLLGSLTWLYAVLLLLSVLVIELLILSRSRK
jgi:hypothetical protein